MYSHNKIISNFITKNKLCPSGSITLHPHEVATLVKEIESSHLKIKHATESLAKANERLKRYSDAIDEECVLWDFVVDDEDPRKSIQRLLDITDAVARDPEVNSKARKFAIEQQIEVLEGLGINPNNESEDRVVAIIHNKIEQLKQEKSNG